MDKIVFKDNKLSVVLSKRDDALWFEMEDLENGIKWGEVPLMTFEVHLKVLKRCETARKYRIDLMEEVPGGAHVVVGDTCSGISFGLWIRIEDGELSVFLQPMEIYERKPDVYRLFSVNLFPGMMRAERGGSLILPLNSGVICYPKDKPELSDRFLIYGEQERWELCPLMPYTAVDTGRGGLMALATKCAEDTECYAETDGKGNGWTGFGFSFRRWWPDPIDFQNREIRYIPISPKETAYVSVAKRVRKHVIDDLRKPTIKERVEESPEFRYLLDAYIMKMFYAVETGVGAIVREAGTEESFTSFQTVMTFSEAKDSLRRLHDAGVGKILTEGVGWMPRGHDGMYPTRFPADERLGGQKGWEELVSFGNSLGYHMSTHDNFGDVYEVSPNFDREIVIHDMFGELMAWGCWGGGINYRVAGTLLSHSQLEGQLQKMQEIGLRGHYYIDALGNPLDVNYHPKNGGPRSLHARGIVHILETAKRVCGSVGTEFGFLYSMIPADCVAYSCYGWGLKRPMPNWQVSRMCDKNLPIWHLVMNGLMLTEGHGHTWQAVMKKILIGLHPRTEWSTRPGIHPVLDDAMIRAIKAEYDLVIGQLGYIQTMEMTDFYEPSDDVIVSRFEDGTEITADFKKEELLLNGKRIARPEGLLEQ